MIPLKDINPTKRRPVVTWGLIALNLGVWIFQLTTGADVAKDFGVIPLELTHEPGIASYARLVSSMFVHGGWFHLLGNMWFLHVFGDNVEDAIGRGPYLGFYVAAGLAAAALHVVIDPMSEVPMVGASGAIAGVLGGYLILHPKARVITLFFVFFVELPAWIFLFVWFGLQLFHGFSSLNDDVSHDGGVAFFAHVGGFVAGLAMIWVMKRSGETA